MFSRGVTVIPVLPPRIKFPDSASLWLNLLHIRVGADITKGGTKRINEIEIQSRKERKVVEILRDEARPVA